MVHTPQKPHRQECEFDVATPASFSTTLYQRTSEKCKTASGVGETAVGGMSPCCCGLSA